MKGWDRYMNVWNFWMPVNACMTKDGLPRRLRLLAMTWIPAFAGMTVKNKIIYEKKFISMRRVLDACPRSD